MMASRSQYNGGSLAKPDAATKGKIVRKAPTETMISDVAISGEQSCFQ
jgi:hypothetical protein